MGEGLSIDGIDVGEPKNVFLGWIARVYLFLHPKANLVMLVEGYDRLGKKALGKGR